MRDRQRSFEIDVEFRGLDLFWSHLQGPMRVFDGLRDPRAISSRFSTYCL